ncbi:hypothetical protein LTR17_007177 [Elasticomyces elasticus]|nr:hypothetical protein LTR17_007177 [Elasticomyces elasticus]
MNVHNHFGNNAGNGMQGGTINIAGDYHEHHNTPSDADVASGRSRRAAGLLRSLFNFADFGQACLRSLHFAGMYKKHDDHKRTPETGNWMFAHDQYKAWHEGGGVLGITGMHISAHEERLAKNSIAEASMVLWYSFGYGADSQYCSEVGMLRSLLWQLLKDDEKLLAVFVQGSSFADRCRTQGKPGVDWNWDVSLLRELFDCMVKTSQDQGRRIRIFLDAMDECEDDVSCDIVQLFRLEGDASKIAPDLCYSTRPQPFQELHRNFRIKLERENSGDMRKFVDAKFPATAAALSLDELEAVKNQLCSRAEHCFQWLVWICPKVLKLINMGESYDDIVEAMRGFPQELGKVYAQQLKEISDEDIPRALRLFQWLSLSCNCPFVNKDLCYAVCLEDGEVYESIEDVVDGSPHWCGNFDTFCNRAIDWSGNLVQRLSTVIPESQSQEVLFSEPTLHELVFDHHSVKEFMICSGLQQLHNRLAGKAQSFSLTSMRHRLAGRCLSYLRCKEVVAFRESRTRLMEHISPGMSRLAGQPVPPMAAPPLALAAAIQWLFLADQVENDVAWVPQILDLFGQSDTVTLLHLRAMRNLTWVGSKCKVNYANSTLLHALLDFGLVNTLLEIYHPSRDATPSTKKQLRSTRKLLDRDLDAQDGQGRTPLSIAVEHQLDGLVVFLMERGARADIPDINGWTPLHYAAAFGADATIKTLLRSDEAFADVKDLSGLTPLAIAIRTNNQNNRLATVELLLQKGTLGVHNRKVNFLPLPPHDCNPENMTQEAFVRILRNSTPSTALPFEKCVRCQAAEINRNDDLFLLFNGWLSGLNTPLMHAAWRGSPELLALLLRCNNIDGSLQGHNGTSPLHWLIGRHDHSGKFALNSENVRLLVGSEKFALDVKGLSGCSPLTLACITGDVVATQALLSSRAVDVRSKDVVGCTPLEHAVREGHVEVVKLLIEFKLEFDEKCSEGTTLLAMACEFGHSAIVKLLLETGKFRFCTGDTCGRTPLLFAVRGGHVKVVELLIDAARRDPITSVASNNHQRHRFRFPVRGGHVSARFRGDQTTCVAFVEAVTAGVASVAWRIKLMTSGLFPPPVAFLMVAIDCGHLDVVRLLLFGYSLISDHRATVNVLLWPHYREDYGQGTRGDWPSCPLVLAGRHYANPSLCESWEQLIERERILRYLLKYICVVYEVENREEADWESVTSDGGTGE